jgi:hypothetical protein
MKIDFSLGFFTGFSIGMLFGMMFMDCMVIQPRQKKAIEKEYAQWMVSDKKTGEIKIVWED